MQQKVLIVIHTDEYNGLPATLLLRTCTKDIQFPYNKVRGDRKSVV